MVRVNVKVDINLGGSDKGGGRARIIQRARELFIERGFSDVSMQQIADAAGLRKASLYYHFEDKNTLFTEIVLSEMRRMSDAVRKRLEEGGDFRTLIEDLAYTQLSQVQGDVVRLVTDFRQHVPEPEHEEVHAELLKLANVFEQAFKRAAADGAKLEMEPKIAAVLFFHMVLALSEHGYVDPMLNLPEPRAAAKLVTKALLDGILRRMS